MDTQRRERIEIRGGRGRERERERKGERGRERERERERESVSGEEVERVMAEKHRKNDRESVGKIFDIGSAARHSRVEVSRATLSPSLAGGQLGPANVVGLLWKGLSSLAWCFAAARSPLHRAGCWPVQCSLRAFVRVRCNIIRLVEKVSLYMYKNIEARLPLALLENCLLASCDSHSHRRDTAAIFAPAQGG